MKKERENIAAVMQLRALLLTGSGQTLKDWAAERNLLPDTVQKVIRRYWGAMTYAETPSPRGAVTRHILTEMSKTVKTLKMD